MVGRVQGNRVAVTTFVVVAVLAATVAGAYAVNSGGGNGNANVQLSKTVTTAKLTPSLTLGFTVDQPTAIPGDQLTYTATLSNTGATVTVSGQLSANATGSTDATVASFDDVVWTGKCDGHRCQDHHSNHGHDVSQWSALAGQAGKVTGYNPTNAPATSSGLVLQATPVPTAGVTYPASGDRIAGTVIGRNKMATWNYTATIALTSAQAAQFQDPSKVGEIRNSFRTEVTPRNGNAAQPPTVNTEFGQVLFTGDQATIGTVADATINVSLPGGTTTTIDKSMVARLAAIAPSGTVTATTKYTVPVPAAKAANETDAAYLARLAALNSTALTATAAASGASPTGPITAQPTSVTATTVEQLPVVTVTKTGPAAGNAGDTVTYQLALANTGAAPATSLTLVDQVPAGNPATVTGAPASLTPNATATAQASYNVPVTQPTGPLTDTAAVTWADAHGNSYGPVTSQATTQITARNLVAHIVLTPTTAGPNVTGTTQTLTATVTDQANTPVAGQTVTFTVTGPNATTGTAVTDNTGAAAFTYTGTLNGSDIAQAVVATLTSNTATIGWVTPIVPVSTTTVHGRYFPNPTNAGPFVIQPGETPLFEQDTPNLNFNPPYGTIPHTPPGYNIGVATRPYTNIATDPQGNYAGQTVAQGNGHQAGLGDMFVFQAVYTGTYIVKDAGDVTFNFFSDDGFIFGVGNGATRVSGSNGNPPADGLTPFERYPVMGAYNYVTAPVANNITVHFPAPGTYPYEVDYSECCGGEDAITMAANGTGVPAAGSLALTPTNPANQTVGQPLALNLQALTATGTAAPGLDVTVTVSGVNAQTVTGATDAQGHVVIPYTGTQTGCDNVLAAANLSGSPTVSNTISVCWDYNPTQPGGPPVSTITGTTPADGAIITKPTDLCATITPPPGKDITGWTVTLQSTRTGTQPTTLASASTPPPACPLTTIDPTKLPNGDYTITITVTDNGGGTGTLPISIVVDGQLKLGRFTQTFQDMNIPVGGIPIQVTRTYDSLDKDNTGDFGNGWRLGLANYRITTNKPLGAGIWNMYSQSCNLFCLTGFSTNSPHTVTVTDPGGHQEIFDATPTGGSNVFWEGDMAFTPRTGTDTTSKLEVNGDAHFYYSTAGGQLLAGGTNGPVYNPQQYKLTLKSGMVLILDKGTGLVSETDRAGNSVTVDSAGVHSSLGPSISIYRGSANRIAAIYGPDGAGVGYVYDTNGDLVTVNDQLTNPTTFAYTNHYLTSVTGPGSVPLRRLDYQSDGRLKSVTDANGTVTNITIDVGARTETQFANDNLRSLTQQFDERGNATLTIESVDGVSHSYRYEFNSHDLPTKNTDPNLHSVTADYDPTTDDLLRYTDANGHSTSFTYNAAGQPTTITSAADSGHPVVLAYFPNGTLQSVTDPDGRTRTFTYYPNGLRQTATDPVHPATVFTYTPEGRLASSTNGNGQLATFEYNQGGRLRKRTDPDGVTTYGYDNLGQRTDMDDASGHTHWTIDPLGLIDSIATPQGTVTYGYNGTRRATMNSPAGSFAYGYGTNGELTRLTGPEGTTTLTYEYGGVRTVNRPNGVTTTRGHDPGGQLTDIVHAKQNTTLASFHTVLDAAGNRRRVDQTVGGQTWTETYDVDNLDRLTGVTYGDSGRTVRYDYYPSGNRKTMTVTGAADAGATSYLYDNAQQLKTVTGPQGTISNNYDNNGSLLGASDGSSYTWNSNGLMRSATRRGITERYTYDGDGVRTAVNGTSWLWDRNSGMPTLLSDGISSFNGTLSATTNGTTTFPLSDGLGSTRATTDTAGNVTGTASYDVYGGNRSTSGPSTPLGYTGQYADSTGLLHLRSRQYDPSIGRFLSRDNVQPNAFGVNGFNSYGYVSGAPNTAVDPTGNIEFVFEANQDSKSTVTAEGLADDVGEATTRGYTQLGSGKGYEVRVPYNKSRDVVVRIMERGGPRSNGYYRISVDGKSAVDAFGNFSMNPALTHFALEGQSLSHIMWVIGILL